jgi:glycosyltransferase involved in cell wall biosynthesis
LPRLKGKRQPFLGSYFQAKRNGLCNVADRFVFGFALADAAWNSWAFGDPNAIFVPIDRYVEFHVRAPKIVRRLRSKLHGVAVGAILPIQAPFVAAVVNTPGAFGDYNYPVKRYEAMACGRPVVASRTAGTAHGICRRLRDYPDRLVATGDAAALAGALVSAPDLGAVGYGPQPAWGASGAELEAAVRRIGG